MKRKKKLAFFERALALLVLTSMAFLYQNCGSTESGLDQEIAFVEQAKIDSLPFAYDVDVDLMAYMSCESDALSASDTYFNFKMGSYSEGGGVKIRNKYREAVAGYTKERALDFLAASPRNSNTGVVMAVRNSGDLRLPSPSVDDNLGRALMSSLSWDKSFNVTLTSRKIASYLWDQFDKGVNYFPMLPLQYPDRILEGEIKFNGPGLAIQNSIRGLLESDHYLALTFAADDQQGQAEGALARSPRTLNDIDPAARTSVWGKGYQFTFSQYDGTRAASPRAAVSGMRGYSLTDGSSLDEEWLCPPDERYIIVRAADAHRRFDDAPAKRSNGTSDNEPWHTIGDGNGFGDYNDGGAGVGGYYMSRKSVDVTYETYDHDNNPSTPEVVKTYDHDNNSETPSLVNYDLEEAFTHEKVLCPTVPDFADRADQNKAAWSRVRSVLSTDKWYVFRGSRYNCIVPKREDNSCYGTLNSANGGLRKIMYLRNEDFPEDRIKLRLDLEHQNVRDPNPPRITDGSCNATNGMLCPEILSVCYKKPK